MRKFVIWITIVALIVSIVGTGVIVFVETSSPLPSSSSELTATGTTETTRVMSGSTLSGNNI